MPSSHGWYEAQSGDPNIAACPYRVLVIPGKARQYLPGQSNTVTHTNINKNIAIRAQNPLEPFYCNKICLFDQVDLKKVCVCSKNGVLKNDESLHPLEKSPVRQFEQRLSPSDKYSCSPFPLKI